MTPTLPTDLISAKLFPVMGEMKTVAYVPFSLVMAHEAQARTNHSQSVQRLADRGGLDCTELAAVLEDRPWRLMSSEDAWRAICAKLSPTPAVHSADGLLPCPFCGSSAEMSEYGFAHCTNRACTGHYGAPTREQWNTRHQGAGWMPVRERLPEVNGPIVVGYNRYLKILIGLIRFTTEHGNAYAGTEHDGEPTWELLTYFDVGGGTPALNRIVIDALAVTDWTYLQPLPTAPGQEQPNV